MRAFLFCLALLPVFALSCSAPPKASQDVSLPDVTGHESLTKDAADAITDLSCPPGTASLAPSPIAIQAEPLALWPEGADRALPDGMRFEGGWILSSLHKGFGGLSGLDLLPDGSLLAVSDEGAFVWLELKDAAPSGKGMLAYMKGADGAYLSGKQDGDSEGLSLSNGLAYVSFERRHRIEAFALNACGAEARSVAVMDLPHAIDGVRIEENAGAEALATNGSLLAGYEQVIKGQSALVTADDTGFAVTFLEPAASGFNGPLVGMSDALPTGDASRQVIFALRRQYNPVFGNRLTVEARYIHEETSGLASDSQPLFELAPPMAVDNFEGIAAEQLATGDYRLWLVSDNNFSGRQRTLLYKFEITLP